MATLLGLPFRLLRRCLHTVYGDFLPEHFSQVTYHIPVEQGQFIGEIIMNFVTTGDITKKVRATGVQADRDAVSYALRKAGVEPIGRAGIVRLFSESAVDSVREFLERKRQGRSCHDRVHRATVETAIDDPKTDVRNAGVIG